MELDLADFEELISEKAIQDRIVELGKQISQDFPDGNLVVVGVLKGAFVFMADLVRHLAPNITCDFLRVSSYKGVHSTGKVRIDFDLTQPIEGRDVLIVEDITDTGLTAHFLIKALGVRGAKSLSLCTLLDKPARRKPDIEVPVAYRGFEIENKFVIGYGLDFDGQFRNLRSILALKPEAAERLGY